MDIRSAYNSGVAGLQNASAQLNNASSKINQSTIDSLNAQTQDAPLEDVSLSTDRTPESLTTELVNMKVAEFQAKASTKVITTADDAMGTLINTSV